MNEYVVSDFSPDLVRAFWSTPSWRSRLAVAVEMVLWRSMYFFREKVLFLK